MKRHSVLLMVVAGFLFSPGCGLRAGEAERPDKMTAARAALEDELFPLVQKRVETQLTEHPESWKDEQTVTLLMRALYGQKKHKDMLVRLEEAVKRGGERPAYLFWQAMAQYELGQYDRAVAELEQLDKRYPGNSYRGRCTRLLAWCRLQTGNTNEALQAFARYDRDCADGSEVNQNLLEWAQTLVRAGEPDRAEELLGRLVSREIPYGLAREATYWQGKALFNQSKLSQANTVFSRLSQDRAADVDLRAESLMSLARVCEAQTNLEAAVSALLKVPDLARREPVRLDAQASLGRLLLSLKRVDEATPLVKQFVSGHPGDARASALQLQLAGTLLDNGQYEASAEEYLHHLETFTNSTEMAVASRGRAWALFNLEKYSEAAAAFQKAYGLFKNPVAKQRCLFKLGDARLANKQYAEAAETYQRYIAEFPQSELVPRALLLLAESLQKSGNGEQAEKTLQRTVDQYPGTPEAEEALLRLGDLRRSQGRWKEALANYNGLITTYTNGCFLAEALAGRGEVHYRIMAFDNALQDFSRLVKAYPDGEPAQQGYYMLGLSYYCLHREVEAVSVLSKFVSEHPNSTWAPAALFWLGKYDYNGGNYESASRRFIAVAEKYPRSQFADDALLFAGWAQLKRKEYVQAVELLGRLAKDYPDSPKTAEARFAQGNAMHELAQFSGAILAFDEIINKHGDSDLVAPAWMRKADAQFMLGTDDKKRYEEAMHSYRVVAGTADAPVELIMEAEYKVGRCLQKLDRPDEALEQYHTKVLVRFLDDRENEKWHNQASELWFTRASFKAAEILETQQDWRGMVRVLQRVVDAGVPAADETKARIAQIKSDHFVSFW